MVFTARDVSHHIEMSSLDLLTVQRYPSDPFSFLFPVQSNDQTALFIPITTSSPFSRSASTVLHLRSTTTFCIPVQVGFPVFPVFMPSTSPPCSDGMPIFPVSSRLSITLISGCFTSEIGPQMGVRFVLGSLERVGNRFWELAREEGIDFLVVIFQCSEVLVVRSNLQKRSDQI